MDVFAKNARAETHCALAVKWGAHRPSPSRSLLNSSSFRAWRTIGVIISRLSQRPSASLLNAAAFLLHHGVLDMYNSVDNREINGSKGPAYGSVQTEDGTGFRCLLVECAFTFQAGARDGGWSLIVEKNVFGPAVLSRCWRTLKITAEMALSPSL